MGMGMGSLQSFPITQRRLELSDRCAGAPAMASGSPSLNQSHQPEHLVRRRRKRKHKAASEATISRCELEPGDRQQGRHVYAFAAPESLSWLCAFLFFKKKIFYSFYRAKTLELSGFRHAIFMLNEFGFSQMNTVTT